MLHAHDEKDEPIARFFTEKLPAGWFSAPPAVEWDDEEILCVGTLAPASDATRFRESTRAARIAIAREAEARFGRTVSWGVQHDGVETLFTTQRTPVTSGLAFRERAVLDTLMDAGVARSRGDAVTWCIKLVERHEGEWLGELREALTGVDRTGGEGPILL
jgi:hypothetical protein